MGRTTRTTPDEQHASSLFALDLPGAKGARSAPLIGVVQSALAWPDTRPVVELYRGDDELLTAPPSIMRSLAAMLLAADVAEGLR